MNEIIDQYNDPTFIHLYALTRDKPRVREMLKSAAFEKTAGATLPTTAFAWQEERRFPVHTKEDTLASLLYRQKCASVPSHVDHTLEQAALVFGLATPIEKTANAQLIPITAHKGGQAALDSQGYFNVPNSNQTYLSDELQALQDSQDPADMLKFHNRINPAQQLQQVNRTENSLIAQPAPLPPTALPKVGAPKLAYALPEERRLPLNNVASIKLAEHVLNRDFERLPLEKRASAYQNLMDAAQVHAVDLEIFTTKMAGMVACSADILRDALETRATAAGPGKVRVAFDKMASELASAPPLLRDRADLVKLAGAIHTLDKAADLERHYDRKLIDPVRTVFNTNIKLAEDMCDVAGMPVPCSQVMALPPEVWNQLDVPEMADAAEAGDAVTFKQTFDTLPLDMKVALQAYL